MKVIRRTDELVNRLMPAILCGLLAEGDTLPSDQMLGSQHNVSRTVVREAFRILGAKGLIEAKPRTGTRVAPSHASDAFLCARRSIHASSAASSAAPRSSIH